MNSDVTLSYKFTFMSEKISNYDVETLFTTRKNSSINRELLEMKNCINKYGTGIGSVDSILIALKGYLAPSNSEVDRNKVIMNICIPFMTGSKPVKTNLIHISKNILQETPLTSKWRPEVALQQMGINGENAILKDQIALVNEKSKMKRSIESCDTIDIKPCLSGRKDSKRNNREYSSSSESSDSDMVEQNDVSYRMQSYSIGPNDRTQPKPVIKFICKDLASEPSPEVSLSENFYKNVVFLAECDLERKCIEEIKALKINIVLSKNIEETLKICESILRDGKRITAVLFDLFRKSSIESEVVRKIKKLENDMSSNICLCAVLSDPKDADKCKKLGINEFCNLYLVLKPLSSIELNKLITKIDFS